MKLFVFTFAMLAIVVFCRREKGQGCIKGTKIDIGGNEFLCKKKKGNGAWVHKASKQRNQNKAGGPGGAPCTDDDNATCFADRGHCNQYTTKGEEMDRVCPGTCESCDGCRCQDANQWHKYCPFWAQYCDSPGVLGNWMTTNCRKSCGKCKCKCCSYMGKQHKLGARIQIPDKCGELVCEESLVADPSPLIKGAAKHEVSHPDELTLNFHAVHAGADCCILPGEAMNEDGSSSPNGSMVAEGWSGQLSTIHGTFSTTCCHGVLSVPLDEANPTTKTPKFETLPQCRIESLSFALDISGSMGGGTMNIWKPVATNLVEEMAKRQVNIDLHYLFTYVDTIQAALTTTNHSEFSSEINNWNTFQGSQELTFTALKHAMEQVATNAFVCIWTDEIGDDTNNATLKAEILNLKATTNSEIFFMAVTKQAPTSTPSPARKSRDVEENDEDDKTKNRANLNIAHFKAKFDDIGHVMDITNDQNVITRIIQIMKETAICNQMSTPVLT